MQWLLANCQQKTVEVAGELHPSSRLLSRRPQWLWSTSVIFCDACREEGDTCCTDNWSLADWRSLHVDVRVWEAESRCRLSMCRVTVVSCNDAWRRSACGRQGRRSRQRLSDDGYSYEGWKWGTLLRPHCWRGRHWPALAGPLSFRCLQTIQTHHFVERNWHPWSALSKPQGRVRLSWKTKH